jgi:methylenetetrahydrofolate dehydrogenase (NADP+)/methenyltetrahydrofolate cyclohydrolase
MKSILLDGKPIAMMLLNENATVMICHSRTKNLSYIVKQTGIVVGAVGIPEFIKADWIKDGGVGPMTIATLISQTVDSAENSMK